MIYLLDSDLNGTDSYEPYIKSKQVTRFPIDSFPAFDNAVTHIIDSGAGNNDLVIIDTMTSLKDTVMSDLRMGVDDGKPIWDKRMVYLNKKEESGWSAYDACTQMILRRIRNLRARDIRMILNAQTGGQKENPMDISKIEGPAMNPALYTLMAAITSDIFRLRMLDGDEEINGKVVPAFTRVLDLRPDGTHITKFHVASEQSEKVPRRIIAPTLPKLYRALNKKTSNLGIYGLPGVGKTTFALSELIIEKETHVKNS